jgi:hypothetical protein
MITNILPLDQQLFPLPLLLHSVSLRFAVAVAPTETIYLKSSGTRYLIITNGDRTAKVVFVNSQGYHWNDNILTKITESELTVGSYLIIAAKEGYLIHCHGLRYHITPSVTRHYLNDIEIEWKSSGIIVSNVTITVDSPGWKISGVSDIPTSEKMIDTILHGDGDDISMINGFREALAHMNDDYDPFANIYPTSEY